MIEGAEDEILDPLRYKVLESALLIVETHDHKVPGVYAQIKERFELTHHVRTVTSGSRDPNSSELLRPLSDDVKWPLMGEGRPSAMRWLVLYPRSVYESEPNLER